MKLPSLLQDSAGLPIETDQQHGEWLKYFWLFYAKYFLN